jgi:hypothetical protein
MELRPPWESVSCAATRESCKVLWNPEVFTVFVRALHSLSCAISIQSIPPHPASLRPILILFPHLRLGLLNGLFRCGFSTKLRFKYTEQRTRRSEGRVYTASIPVVQIDSEGFWLWCITYRITGCLDFFYRRVFYFLEYRTMEKSKNPVILCYTLSSEPFRTNQI